MLRRAIARGIKVSAARRRAASMTLALATLMFPFPRMVQSQDTPPRIQSAMEAEFVFNLAKFIEWRRNSFADSIAPFVVSVLGDEELRTNLTLRSAGKTVNGRSLRIQKLVHGQDPRGCHILFIGSSEQRESATVLQVLRATRILTIGDTENFIRQGGAVRFFMENDRMRFEINLDATARAKLKVSAKLLGVAWVTTDDRPQRHLR
jgi:hypothetical protein